MPTVNPRQALAQKTVVDQLPLSEPDRIKANQAIASNLTGANLGSTHWFFHFTAQWDHAGSGPLMAADFTVSIQDLPGLTFTRELGHQKGSFYVETGQNMVRVPGEVRVVAKNIERPFGSLKLEVPGLALDGVTLKKRTYDLPSRIADGPLPLIVEGNTNLIGFPKNDPALRFLVKGKVETKSFKITAKVSGTGELGAEYASEVEKALEFEEVAKLGLKTILKAGAKIGGSAGLDFEFTIDVLYLRENELTVTQQNLPK